MTKAMSPPEFVEWGDAYLVAPGEDSWAEVFPTQGIFDVEVWKEEPARSEFDGEMGLVYYEQRDVRCWCSRELTVDGVRAVLDRFGLKLPEELARLLTTWREKFWEAHDYDNPFPEERG